MVTPERFLAIRKAYGLSNERTVDLLRMRDLSTVRRYSTGEGVITGPVSIIMEMLEAGELPARYIPARPERRVKRGNKQG